MLNLSYVLIGLCAGIFSGFFGLGGGLAVIPMLVYIYGLSQHQAQGTSLAMMVPPITLLAAIKYYYSGNVKIGMAIFLAVGFAMGGLLSAGFVQHVPDALLKRVFGMILLAVSIHMLFFS